jgi:hypothetical protein
MNTVSFSDIAIISCGTMSLELKHLQQEGFLDTPSLHFTTPGLHQDCRELENQLVSQIDKVKQQYKKIIVVYGGKFCYVNTDQPSRKMHNIIEESGTGIRRINSTHCMDMLASAEERDRIAQEMADGLPVWWMTPGWVKYRHQVFKGWDKALANENFPRHTGGAIVLDGINFMDTLMEENPEEYLDYADWMGITLMPYTITLDRFKNLLTEEARAFSL